MKICVDAGHGGRDPGAIGTEPIELQEKHFNLDLSRILEEELEHNGHWVIMTRRRDRTLSLPARASFANQHDAELFVSIHANAATDPGVEGMEVFHFPGSPRSHERADNVLSELLAEFSGHRNRGVKEANFSVLRLTAMPALLVECEFLTNPDQLVFLSSNDTQKRLAQAIARGVGT